MLTCNLNRNFLIPERQYETTDQVLQAVHKKEVDIALLDAFTAASLQSKIVGYSLKVKKMINANTGYGVVLSREFVRLESDFRSFIASNQDKISSFTSNMTEKLHVSTSLLSLQIRQDGMTPQ